MPSPIAPGAHNPSQYTKEEIAGHYVRRLKKDMREQISQHIPERHPRYPDTLASPGHCQQVLRQQTPRPGRPRTPKLLANLFVCLAMENPAWVYTRIRGNLAVLGHRRPTA